MEDGTDSQVSREPQEDDLVKLCRDLNEAGAEYVIIGGMAVIYHGMVRATEDIDLLIERSRENQQKVISALKALPDGAANELKDDDLDTYKVVRIADNIIIDLMLEACGYSYAEVNQGIEYKEIGGVTIPFASVDMLIRLKNTVREKDAWDRKFLEQLNKPKNPDSNT